MDFAVPWSEGRQHTGAELPGVLPAEVQSLLPRGEVVVQTWRDFRRSRDGFGDIVFVPTAGVKLDAAGQQRRRSLLPVLDPALLEGESPVTAQ